MATSWIKPLHRTGSNSTKAALGQSLEYIMNPDKTMGGELISAYGCDPITVESEFMLSKRQYEHFTGRNQGKNDIIAYHIRMSFPPGEIEPDEVLKTAHELALRWTKGRHQFIVAAHTNTNNPHAHIIFNSTTQDSRMKFKNFKFSSVALRRLSDQVCLEHGLTIIEKPKLSKGWNRAEYLSGEKLPSNRQRLMDMIDNNLVVGQTLTEFISAMRAAGCEIKVGKHIAFKIPNAKKNIRLDSLSDNYSEAALLERLSGKRTVVLKSKSSESVTPKNEMSLMIDLQQKMREGKGEGYRQWGSVFNVKQAAKTLVFLQENDITSYENLCEKASAASSEFHALTGKIKDIENRLTDISELQKQIGTYSKTREIYKKYIAAGRNQDIYDGHTVDIILHQAAKRYFDGLGLKKLPKMAELKQEYATLAAEKKKLYSGYNELRDKSREFVTAKQNAAILLGEPNPPKKSRGYNER